MKRLVLAALTAAALSPAFGAAAQPHSDPGCFLLRSVGDRTVVGHTLYFKVKDAANMHAIAYYRDLQTEKALKLTDELIAEEPTNPYLYELKGPTLFEIGRSAEAEPAHRKSVELNPEAPILRMNLGQAELAEDKPAKTDDAIVQIRRSLDTEPDNPFGWLLLAHPRIGVLNTTLENVFHISFPPLPINNVAGMGLVEGLLLTSLTFVLVGFGSSYLLRAASGRDIPVAELSTTAVASVAGTVLYALIASLVGQPGMLTSTLVRAAVLVAIGALLFGLVVLRAIRWVIEPSVAAIGGIGVG